MGDAPKCLAVTTSSQSRPSPGYAEGLDHVGFLCTLVKLRGLWKMWWRDVH